MMRALLFLPLLAAAPAAPEAPLRSPVAAGTVREDRFPETAARYPGGIVARPHVEFANQLGFRPLQLDLYLHADRARAARRPLILWIHGGGWSRGDARGSAAFADFPAVLAAVAVRGYVVASVDYRLSGEAKFPAQIQDVKAAIRYLRAHAVDYGVDPSRVVVWGGSAGGHLAALAATTCRVTEFDPPASTGRMSRAAAASARPLPQSDCVQGAAVWYAPLDLGQHKAERALALGDNVAAMLGCDGDACVEPARRASPIRYVGADTPPMLLIHGTADEEVGYGQSELMAEALRKAGRPVEMLMIPDVAHGFIGKTPAATRAAHWQALDRTLTFFDRVTKKR
ncbi:alpha/beta hydrolase [Sphingomonas tagetis]|nr:alpha/beta hydrolase [Sphingomonas tagetis]